MLGFGLAIEPQLWALIFVMVRIGAAFIAAPVFGAVSIPLPVRVTLSGAIGVLVLGTDRKSTSELQSLMRISYAVFCLKKKKQNIKTCQTARLSMCRARIRVKLSILHTQ